MATTPRANQIKNTPAGNIAATNVQSALNELDTEKLPITQTSSESVSGIAEIATQAETNTGTDDARIVTPLKLKNRDGAVTALTDSATTDISADKWTWASSSGTRTTTFSFTGDTSEGELTLSATSCLITMPANSLCVSDGISSGGILELSGVSGDKYVIAIRKFGSNYKVVCKNFGQ